MEYLYEQEIVLLKELKKQVNTAEIQQNIVNRVFSISDIGISSRVLFHWEESKLLMENHEAKRWKKFNLIEYTWLKIIQELRKYRISLNTIRDIKRSLTENQLFRNYPDKDLLYETIIRLAPDDKDKQVKELLNQYDIRKEIEAYSSSLLEWIVASIVLIRSNFSLLINSSGDCIPFKFSFLEKYLEYDDFSEFISDSFISISVMNILKEFMLENEIAKPAKRLKLLNDSEELVLKKIRDEKVISVLVKKDNDNEIEMIEEFRNENFDKSARLMDILMDQGYQVITIKTQKGDIVNCTNIVKTKLSKI